MYKWLVAVFVGAMVVGAAQAQPKWVEVGVTPKAEKLMVDASRFSLMTPTTSTATYVLGVFKLQDPKAPVAPESVFWVDSRTCTPPAGGMLFAILLMGTEPKAFKWTARNDQMFDVVGKTLCKFHEAVKAESQKSKSKITTINYDKPSFRRNT